MKGFQSNNGNIANVFICLFIIIMQLQLINFIEQMRNKFIERYIYQMGKRTMMMCIVMMMLLVSTASWREEVSSRRSRRTTNDGYNEHTEYEEEIKHNGKIIHSRKYQYDSHDKRIKMIREYNAKVDSENQIAYEEEGGYDKNYLQYDPPMEDLL